ncbi:pectin lyase fold/virulence factor [Fimicolochytrium jonesii]|uniref:pectin lyase fold/virulence factor n=1 Tax=Fimicolochytrium jonesii TaxID=1396493 RepID=UPI0022FE8C9B|nr:pectin lyase fold/virulence factor [Fimicolochytrium jonesii]KAI8821075.1 pectin lyase fold/virulence factor [Fimicolochytrium jonesii]
MDLWTRWGLRHAIALCSRSIKRAAASASPLVPLRSRSASIPIYISEAMLSLKLISAVLLATAQLIFAVTVPPPDAVIVSQNPISTYKGAVAAVGNRTVFPSLSAAINSTNPKLAAYIFLYPGTYKEQAIIRRKAPLRVVGYSPADTDYRANTVLITASTNAIVVGSNDKSATISVHNDDTVLQNINVENSWVGNQAIALSLYGARIGVYGCQLLGWQDTLLTNDGTHFFGKTLIVGAVDYIFGQRSRAFFQKCDMTSSRSGWVTASGVDTVNNTGVYVFNYCTVGKTKNAEATAEGGVYLGRPWREYAHVVWMRSNLSSVINPAGWAKWGATDNPVHTQYYEYNNVGPGADLSKRVNFSRTLTIAEAKKYEIANVLGTPAWWETRYQ